MVLRRDDLAEPLLQPRQHVRRSRVKAAASIAARAIVASGEAPAPFLHWSYYRAGLGCPCRNPRPTGEP
jgi:hypothetical protein